EPKTIITNPKNSRKKSGPAASIVVDMAKTGNQAGEVEPVGRRNPPAMDWPSTLAEHNHWLRTALFARLGHWQAVDEVMQEVCLAAVSRRAPLDDSARAGGWLYRVALRQALLYRRRSGRQRRLLNGYAQSRGTDAGTVPDPLAVLILEERRERIRDALLTLPRRDAEILLLKYTERWTGRELAL